jgi:N-hydroxyarylamine O-acetyltransferase
MSEDSQLFRNVEGRKILVIGQDRHSLDVVVEEAGAAGVEVRSMTAPEADGALSGRFDLVAFTGDVPRQQRLALEQEALFHNPDSSFVGIHLPFAVSQLVEAARPGSGPSVDLAAYFRRIGYAGPAEPTLAVLRSLHELHPAAIPFEAIDVLLGRGIDISPQAVDAKLIGRQRGGYCYEQNGLFARVLREIGFEVEGLAAHVRWMSEPGTALPPLTHRVLRITIDGEHWLADVGFGSAVPTAPLRLDDSDPQPTRHETFRVMPLGPHFLLQASVEDEWRPVYSISSEPWLDSQYEMANWFTSTHPGSHFRHRLIVTRTSREARHILADGRLTIRRPDGKTEKRLLDAEQILEALEEVFLLPVEPEWLPVAERAAKAVEGERLARAA